MTGARRHVPKHPPPDEPREDAQGLQQHQPLLDGQPPRHRQDLAREPRDQHRRPEGAEELPKPGRDHPERRGPADADVGEERRLRPVQQLPEGPHLLELWTFRVQLLSVPN